MKKNQDSGSGINIPVPQHCRIQYKLYVLKKSVSTILTPVQSASSAAPQIYCVGGCFCDTIMFLLPIGAEERVRGARYQAVLHALHGEGLLARPHAVPHHQQLH